MFQRVTHTFRCRTRSTNKWNHRASPIDTSSVTRVQPRASKGMTDLLLPPVSYDLCISVVNPSKKISLRGAHPKTTRVDENSTKDHWIYEQLRELNGITASTTLNKVFISRRESRSLSELTRQITPPTKNGHAPPPTESRKNSQSVNPHCVRAG